MSSVREGMIVHFSTHCMVLLLLKIFLRISIQEIIKMFLKICPREFHELMIKSYLWCFLFINYLFHVGAKQKYFIQKKKFFMHKKAGLKEIHKI